jgi:hypothetical protein
LIALLIDVVEQASRELGDLLSGNGSRAADDLVDDVLLDGDRDDRQPHAPGGQCELQVLGVAHVKATDAVWSGGDWTHEFLPARYSPLACMMRPSRAASLRVRRVSGPVMALT